MYAIIRTGGRQYRAEVGALLDVEKLPFDVNQQINIEDVLLVGDADKTVIGQPLVEGAHVKATVMEQFRGEKIIVFHYRQRTSYRKTNGHRQYYTRLRIDDIVMGEVAPVSRATIARSATPRASQTDDLKKIEGIGPKIAGALASAGIDTFSRLAASTELELKAALEAAGMHFAPSLPTWAQQAALAADGDWDGLARLQEQLTAGRKE